MACQSGLIGVGWYFKFGPFTSLPPVQPIPFSNLEENPQERNIKEQDNIFELPLTDLSLHFPQACPYLLDPQDPPLSQESHDQLH